MLSLANGPYEETYNINEYYLLRFGTERLYLLDYERTMDSVFDPRGPVFSNNKISLGITDPDNVQIAESEDGNVFGFVKENSLYAFNTSDNKTTQVFSFYDETHKDERDLYDGNDICILSIDETGNIRFLVRGYMNRGMHEGSIGIACYYYNSSMNTVEEEVYIPFYTSAEYLKQSMGKLAFANSSNKLFLLLDDNLYRVDLVDKSIEVIAENLPGSNYTISEDRHLVAWAEKNEEGLSQKIKLMNLGSGKIMDITSPEGSFIKPLGFAGEDLVYGVASSGDLSTDEFGNTVFLMSVVKIMDEMGNELKTYEKSGIYISDAEVTKTQIRLIRTAKNGNSLASLADDFIMNDDPEQKMANAIEVVATQNLEKIVQIAIKSSMSGSKMKVLTPKQVLYEGQRQIFIGDREKARPFYFVYNVTGLAGICYSAPEAVQMAEACSGRVLDGNGRCVFEKGARSKSKMIEGIEETAPDSESSVAGVLEAMLKREGVNLDCHKLLKGNETIFGILQQNLPDHMVVSLRGCSLESMLCYVNADIPVMALANDGSALLIVGFNEQNTILYNPITGKIMKMGINDSTDYFEANGNRFVVCIPPIR